MLKESPQEEMKQKNNTVVLNLIRQFAPISRVQLAEKTGLSAQTITNIVRRLKNDGLILETGIKSNGSVGRQPIDLDILPEGSYAFGFNIERDLLSKSLVNLKGEVIHYDFDVLEAGEQPETIIDKIVNYVEWVLKSDQLQFDRNKIAGIGIGTPGPINYETGEVVAPPNFPDWRNVPLRQKVREKVGLPIVLDNSSTVAALGEHWRGKWLTDSFLYCYWGIGIGGGLVINGNIYRGKSGNAIEFGHVVVEHKGAICDCGGRGCLEAYASIPAIMNSFPDGIDFETIVKLAKPGSEAFEILKKAAEYIGQALDSTLNLLDVDLVIFGGHKFHLVEQIFLPIIQEYINESLIRSKVAKVALKVSPLGEEAGALGAALLVFHELLLVN